LRGEIHFSFARTEKAFGNSRREIQRDVLGYFAASAPTARKSGVDDLGGTVAAPAVRPGTGERRWAVGAGGAFAQNEHVRPRRRNRGSGSEFLAGGEEFLFARLCTGCLFPGNKRYYTKGPCRGAARRGFR